MRNAIFDPVFVKGNAQSSWRARESAHCSLFRTHSLHMCLSAMVLAFAEPDIHSRSRAGEGRHRRLSLGSLPVLKQFEESLGSLISVAQSANGRTWQPALCAILMLSRAGGD